MEFQAEPQFTPLCPICGHGRGRPDTVMMQRGQRGTSSPNLVRTPYCNAYAERFVPSIKYECLNRVIPLGEGHLRRSITEYLGSLSLRTESSRARQHASPECHGIVLVWSGAPATADGRDAELLLPRRTRSRGHTLSSWRVRPR